MEELNYIENTTLPIELNYEELKDKALSYIQRNNDSTWTNLNPSDPGVTILDQLCFAFTELGYCNNFPIKDILTNKEGQLELKNQFYLPEDILTTSPITIEDFRKYVVDNVKEVINVQITPITSNSFLFDGVHKVEVLINPKIDKDKEIEITQIKNGEEEVCIIKQSTIILDNTFFVLNSCRNLGELFLYPTYLINKNCIVHGQLEIENGFDLTTVLVAIKYAINNYVFPELIQTGYRELIIEGETIDTVFNGPKLKNGWIAEADMEAKRNLVKAYEITEVIQSIEGVLSITDVSFNNLNDFEVISKSEEILVFNFEKKENNTLQTYSNGMSLNAGINNAIIEELSLLEQPIGQISKVTTTKMFPNVPQGKYRDISTYYSIQNTFPDAYAVGSEGVSSNATTFQIAQSRQLKGYLTLFDQVLTNQFMQLANVGGLFSFANSVTGDPTDEQQFYSLETIFEKSNPKYPAPYLCFSPTYYYQSLYKEVPNIRPLLRNFKKHEFSYEIQPIEKKIYDGWANYKSDPYNSYIWGLLSFMEDEEVNLDRRNNILNHLLARHGESPVVIDTIIEGTVYSGNSQKDKVIIKSLYLQNLGLLSYYRTKAYNFIGATPLKITCKDFCKTAQNENKIIDDFCKDTVVKEEGFCEELIKVIIKEERKKWVQGNQKDFIFNTLKVDKEQHITTSDFINYAAVELKLNLLFVLNTYYQDYLITNDDALAYWLITQRKGFLCIESQLLKESADYEIIISEGTEGEFFWRSTKKITYDDIIRIEEDLKKHEGFKNVKKKYSFIKGEGKYKKENFKTIEDSSYSWFIKISCGAGKYKKIAYPFLNNTLVFIFPKFFEGTNWFKTPGFEGKLDYFLENELPVQVEYQIFYKEGKDLKDVIIAYSNWYNSLRFNQKQGTLHGLGLAQNAQKLVEIIINFNKHSYD
ncbi:hypothetical protein [Tenacibaculum halocynthiae]|uniref:hypothetical protein n=1 Tax=Tenacibaculum halocynthiae TaxID=1254437 RepID=UPI003D650B6D